jgi:hypothetical protein
MAPWPREKHRTRHWRDEAIKKPKWGNPMPEDSFEKARKAFFSTATTTPQPIMPPAEFLTPQDDTIAEQVSPAPRDAVAAKFSWKL